VDKIGFCVGEAVIRIFESCAEDSLKIATFDFVEGTPPRQNANKICFCARLVRTFVTKYAETLYHSGL